ncbi:calcium dependent mitochondrial carrier protein [Apiospora arundinis]
MLTPHYRSQTSAPAVQAPPPSTHNNRNSTFGRPVSSLYSQPSPVAATFAAQQLRDEVYANPADISPPSSPDDFGSPERPNDGDVSPIDEGNATMEEPTARPGGAVRSQIPMMRRERRKNSDAAMHALHESKSRERLKQRSNDVRWDKHTGEPTSADRGLPAQVPNAHQYAQGLAQTRGSPQQARKPANDGGSAFGVRLRPTRQGPNAGNAPPAEPAMPPSRPEWRGASGRTPLVPPVKDNRDVSPLNVPPKNARRMHHDPNDDHRAQGVLSPVSSLESETSSPPPAQRATTTQSPSQMPSSRNIAQSSASPVQRVTVDAPDHPSQRYPSPALSDDHRPTVPHQPRSAATHPIPSNPPSSTLFPPNEKAIRRKPAGAAGHNPQPSYSSSVYSQQPEIHPSQRPPGGFPDEWTQPPSRFSVTTYATSATGTPRLSAEEDAPALPTPPQQFSQSPTSLSPSGHSILDRKRPTVSGYEDKPRAHTPSAEPIKINMDSPYYVTSPVPAHPRPSGPHPIPRGNHSRISVASTESSDKVLPLAPPEESARDRVSQLNAQLKSLGNRRININQAIRQMTELMPTDNLLASEAVIAKREAEKRKVEVLRDELAEVQREEYELGLKLHRAYKRMDRDASYEPTTLWVRRVTG